MPRASLLRRRGGAQLLESAADLLGIGRGRFHLEVPLVRRDGESIVVVLPIRVAEPARCGSERRIALQRLAKQHERLEQATFAKRFVPLLQLGSGGGTGFVGGRDSPAQRAHGPWRRVGGSTGSWDRLVAHRGRGRGCGPIAYRDARIRRSGRRSAA